ncbi:MAG: FMN-binding protein [Flavobacteriales bacterium]|nr:FMN-binding protein [Flavobacteriales bacterium]
MSEQQTHIDPEQEVEPSSFKLIGTLSFAGFVSGLILVSVYLFTKPIIEQNKADAMREAIFTVLPGTTTFKTLVLENGELTEADKAGEESVFLGLNDQNAMTGFAISGKESGFQDIIGVLYGYDAVNRRIIGYQVLDCKETPGLGDKIFKNTAFVANFTALAVEPEIVLVKNGAKQQPNEVDAITGATISSKTVVKLLNRSMEKWKAPIDRYLTANPSPVNP